MFKHKDGISHNCTEIWDTFPHFTVCNWYEARSCRQIKFYNPWHTKALTQKLLALGSNYSHSTSSDVRDMCHLSPRNIICRPTVESTRGWNTAGMHRQRSWTVWEARRRAKQQELDVGKIIRVINALVQVAPHQQHSGFLLWGLFLAVGRSWCPCETPSAQLRGNSAAMGNEFPDKHPLNFGTHVHESWPRRIQLSVGNWAQIHPVPTQTLLLCSPWAWAAASPSPLYPCTKPCCGATLQSIHSLLQLPGLLVV